MTVLTVPTWQPQMKTGQAAKQVLIIDEAKAVSPYQEAEIGLMNAGVPAVLLFGGSAVEFSQFPDYSQKLLTDLAVTSLAHVAKSPVETLQIKTVFGAMAEVQFALAGSYDPQIVIPLFPVNDEDAAWGYDALISNLELWTPDKNKHWQQEWWVGVTSNLSHIFPYLQTAVRPDVYKWTTQKLQTIISQPSRWYVPRDPGRSFGWVPGVGRGMVWREKELPRQQEGQGQRVTVGDARK